MLLEMKFNTALEEKKIVMTQGTQKREKKVTGGKNKTFVCHKIAFSSSVLLQTLILYGRQHGLVSSMEPGV